MWTSHGGTLPKKDRNWILFSEEQPREPVYAGFTAGETRAALKKRMEPSYMGTFTSEASCSNHLHWHAKCTMKKRVAQLMLSTQCDACRGKRLRPEPLSVKFSGIVAGNTVVVEDMTCKALQPAIVIDVGFGAGDEEGKIVAAGEPAMVARSKNDKTAVFLAPLLQD